MISIHWAQYKSWSVSLGAGIESGASWLGSLALEHLLIKKRSTFRNFGFQKPKMLDSTTNNSFV